MFKKIEILLKNDVKLDYSVSSLMQGVLMEFIDEDYADELHISGLNPYSQHVEFVDGNMRWVITTLTEQASEKIILPLLNKDIQTITIKHKNLELQIIKKTVVCMEYDELLERTYFGDCKPYINIDFITPTAFKSYGKYQFYPTVEHIFGSLIKKHDSISLSTKIYSEDLINDIKENVEITRYKLRSTFFYMEGIKVPSFMGYVSIKIHGPTQFINLINMLVEFGEYSGVGIKSSIGMGAMKILHNEGKENKIG